MAGFERLCQHSPEGFKASHVVNEDKRDVDSVTLLCDPCQFDGTNENAEGFCSVCLEYLCNSCIKEHKKAKMTRGHRIILEDISKNATAFKEIRKLILCPFHEDMSIVYRCDDHDVFACISCKAETHRKCDNVFEIEKSKGSDTVVDDVFDTLRAINETSRNVQEAKKENINLLYKEQSQILCESKVFCEELIETIKDHKVKFENETKEKVEFAVSEVSKDLDEVTLLAEEGTKSQNMVGTALKYMDNKTAVVIAHQLNSKAQQVRTSIGKLSQGRISVNFIQSQSVRDFPKLGNIVIEHQNGDTEEKKVPQQEHHVIDNSSDAVPDSIETSPSATATSTVNAKVKSSLEKTVIIEDRYRVEEHNDGKFCSVLGSVIFSDGQLLITDIDNSKLKLLSEQFDLQSTLKLPGKPVRMCEIWSDSVAVGFESVKRINRYSIDSGVITYDGGFKTKLYNHGISYHAGNIVALMSDVQYGTSNDARNNVVEIHVMDAINGSVFEIITDLRKMNNMKYILRNIQALHVTEKNELIVAEANSITCFALRRKRMQTVATAKTWYSCHGAIEKDDIENITSDNDCIYVCTRSGKVLQMSREDYRSNRVIISDIGSSARTVSVDDQRDRIVVGCFDDDYIHVFSFK